MKLGLIGVITAAFLASGCTDEGAARRALEAHGYSDIRLTGYRWWGCSDRDSFHTGFEATGPSGVRASGVVCSGWLKGSTVRLD